MQQDTSDIMIRLADLNGAIRISIASASITIVLAITSALYTIWWLAIPLFAMSYGFVHTGAHFYRKRRLLVKGEGP